MSGGTQVTTTNTGPWKEQQGYLLGGFAKAKDLFNKGVPAYYPKETVAGFDPMQLGAQNAITGYALGDRAIGMQMGAENALMQNLAGQTGFTPEQQADLFAGRVDTGDGSPYAAMENALTQGVMSNLQEKILPGLRENQVTYQPGGSSRGDLVNNQAITSAVASGLTKPLAEMYSSAYDRAQTMRLPAAQQMINQRQDAMNLYPSIMNAPLSMYNAVNAVGDRRQAMTQAQINADMQKYRYEAEAPYNALNNYMNLIRGNYGSSSINTAPGPSGLQTLGQIASIVGAFQSDARVKENIEPQGEKWRGFNVYRYNYIGDPTPRRGVMAQEVELTRPDAVVEINGVKHVNYGAL